MVGAFAEFAMRLHLIVGVFRHPTARIDLILEKYNNRLIKIIKILGHLLQLRQIIQYLRVRGLVCRTKFCTSERGVVYPTKS
jgi:hypothetical protein